MGNFTRSLTVRTLVVALAAEGVEVAGLRRTRGADRFASLALERARHALVRAVLLGAGRLNALMRDAELHPKDVQEPEAEDGGGANAHCVVRAERAWRPIFAEGPLEDAKWACEPRSRSRYRYLQQPDDVEG